MLAIANTFCARLISLDELLERPMASSPVKFARPPVKEVVFSVAFSVPQPIRTVDIGTFWHTVASDFPSIEEVAPVSQVIESMSPESQGLVNLDFESVPPLRRVWLVSSDSRTLLQIQGDRFMFNWRKLPGDSDLAYPGNDWIMSNFWKYWAAFEKFLLSIPVGQPTVLQLEHSYFNAIADVDKLSSDLGGVLIDHQLSVHANRFLPIPERFRWATSYLLPSNVGRLHVVAQSAKLTQSGEPIVRLEMTARGLPSSTDNDSLAAWFEVSHVWITRGFSDITRSDAHNMLWGRVS